MKINSALLTEIIESCFDLSMDGRLPSGKRRDFLTLGKRLRGVLVNILTARFDDGTQAVIDVNTKISDLNKSLKNTNDAFNNAAQLIGQLGALVSSLDGLLAMASGFF
jgi:hypothetical protein